MAEWWSALDNSQQIFYIIAFVSTFFLFIQFILTLAGAGHDDVPDADVDGGFDAPEGDHSTGLGIISLRTVIAFFVGFGWSGVAMLRSKQPLAITIVVATAIGLIFLYTVFWLMRSIYGLSEHGNIEAANAQGKTGTVYLRIPKKDEGSGQVQVVVQGRLREYTAITDEYQELPTGSPIQVVKVLDSNTMVVRKI